MRDRMMPAIHVAEKAGTQNLSCGDSNEPTHTDSAMASSSRYSETGWTPPELRQRKKCPRALRSGARKVAKRRAYLNSDVDFTVRLSGLISLNNHCGVIEGYIYLHFLKVVNVKIFL